jgi:hypothetical protein
VLVIGARALALCHVRARGEQTMWNTERFTPLSPVCSFPAFHRSNIPPFHTLGIGYFRKTADILVLQDRVLSSRKSAIVFRRP